MAGTNSQVSVFSGSQDIEKNMYIWRLQDYIRQLNPTGQLVGPRGSYDPNLLFSYKEKIEKIEEDVNNLVESHDNFNNDQEIRVLISNIQQIILAYKSLMDKDARELNEKLFDMVWKQNNLPNHFKVSSITGRRPTGGRTKKRRNKRRRTQRRKRTYK
jgi:hypothetical protein